MVVDKIKFTIVRKPDLDTAIDTFIAPSWDKVFAKYGSHHFDVFWNAVGEATVVLLD